MPEIPRFTSQVAIDGTALPRESAATAGTAGTALAEGMAKVSAQFAEVARAAAAQDLTTKAVQIDTDHAKAMTDLTQEFASDTDPATAPARYQARVKALQDTTLAGITDEALRNHVQRNIVQREPVYYATVAQQAAHGVKQVAIGTATAAASDNAKMLADAPNEAQQLLAMQAIKKAAASVLATNAVTPEQGRLLVSKAYTEAVLSRSTRDLPGAQALLERLKPEMDAGHVVQAEQSLRAASVDAAGAAVATRLLGGGGGAPASPAPQLTPIVRERADAVRQGMIRRGWSEAAATGLAANAVQESGADPATVPGDGGISHGLFQWNKERLAAFQAKYGKLPGQATLDEQLDFADAELRGTERAAGAALAAAATGEEAAKIASTRYLRPRDTAAEEPRRAGIAAALGGNRAGGLPDVPTPVAQEIAQRLNITLDGAKLGTDRTYTDGIRQTLFDGLRTAYGNPVLAAAALTAGPGRVDGWIRTFGDPRTGAITNEQFASSIPEAGARAFVRKMQALDGTGGGERIDRAAMVRQVMAETQGNPQLQAAAMRHLQQGLAVQQMADLDAQREEARREKAQREAAEATGNAFVQQLYTDPTKADTKAVIESPFLTYKQKHDLMQMHAATLQRDDGRDAKTYGPGFFEIYRRVHAPDGDPERITDPGVLYGLAGQNGALTVAGVDKLAQEIAGRRTPDGEAEAQMKRQFFELARQQLSGADPLLKLKDPQGDAIMLRFMAQALPAYDAGKKAGKSAAQLLNPDSPDYIGKSIATFKRPREVFMRDMMGANADPLTGTTPAATDPGSPAAAAPDPKSQPGIVADYRAGRITREEAAKRLRDGGFAAPAPAAAPQPSVPVN